METENRKRVNQSRHSAGFVEHLTVVGNGSRTQCLEGECRSDGSDGSGTGGEDGRGVEFVSASVLYSCK